MTASTSLAPRAARWLVLGFLLLALAAGAACGTKSDPQLPEGQTDRYPRQYPNPNEP